LRTRTPLKLAAALLSLGLIAAACGDSDDTADAPTTTAADAGATTTAAAGEEEDGPSTDEVYVPKDGLSGTLTGAGATFPNPVFQDWNFVYSGEVQTGVSINYQSIGSGGGIEQFLLQTVDFGSSERYLRDDALEQANADRGCDAIQFPVLFGAVTIAFGDDRFDGLVLDAETIADIFQRTITNYNDPKIAALNPGFDLPDLEIIPVHRSDGSGTTSVFTTWLEWAAGDGTDGDGGESRFGEGQEAQNWALGSGTEVQWPAGTIGGQGNEGVTAGTQQNPGGLGYVNQAYALINQLPTAAIVNSDGNAVQATLEATTEALEVLEVPDSFQFDILGVGGEGFPVVGANWIFTYECGYEEMTRDMLVDYWTWATQTDQAIELARDLGYAPLGEGLRARVLEAIQRTGSQD
jgi:phosphate transport system substrate-binding protein